MLSPFVFIYSFIKYANKRKITRDEPLANTRFIKPTCLKDCINSIFNFAHYFNNLWCITWFADVLGYYHILF